MESMKKVLSNPAFYFTLVSLVFATAGIEPSDLTTFDILFDKLRLILQKPSGTSQGEGFLIVLR